MTLKLFNGENELKALIILSDVYGSKKLASFPMSLMFPSYSVVQCAKAKDCVDCSFSRMLSVSVKQILGRKSRFEVVRA